MKVSHFTVELLVQATRNLQEAYATHLKKAGDIIVDEREKAILIEFQTLQVTLNTMSVALMQVCIDLTIWLTTCLVPTSGFSGSQYY